MDKHGNNFIIEHNILMHIKIHVIHCTVSKIYLISLMSNRYKLWQVNMDWWWLTILLPSDTNISPSTSSHSSWENKLYLWAPLWPGGATWYHEYWSTLVQVIACCLQTASHYLNQCWLRIREVLWYSLGVIWWETHKIQWSAVITRSNIVSYYIKDYRNWRRISNRCWINKRHPTPRPNGRAMGCLLWIFVRKLTTLKRHHIVWSINMCLKITSPK